MTVPTTEPTELVAGDTWAWDRDLADYPVSGGWSLTYVFVNAEQRFTIDSTTSGSLHRMSMTAAISSAKIPGTYTWTLFAKKAGERYRVGSGETVVVPNYEGDRPFDTRSHARKTLEAIQAVIEGRATLDQQAYTINGRSITRMPVTDLLRFRDVYKAEVSREQAAERLRQGGLGGAILARF